MRWINVCHPVTGGKAVVSERTLAAHREAGWIPEGEHPGPGQPEQPEQDHAEPGRRVSRASETHEEGEK